MSGYQKICVERKDVNQGKKVRCSGAKLSCTRRAYDRSKETEVLFRITPFAWDAGGESQGRQGGLGKGRGYGS